MWVVIDVDWEGGKNGEKNGGDMGLFGLGVIFNCKEMILGFR